MGLFENLTAHSALSAILEREKAFILAGDIPSAHGLMPEKERLMRRIARSPLKRGQLEALRKRAARNNQLLRASERGFRSVEMRLKAMQDTKQALSTYGRDGQRAPLSRGNGHFNKRA